MGLLLTAEPSAEVLDLTSAKNYLRVDHTNDDTLITGFIKSARIDAENHCQRAFVEQTWTYTLVDFPRTSYAIHLPRPRLIGSPDSFTYVKTDGTTGTLEKNVDYDLDQSDETARLVPYGTNFWPATKYGLATSVSIEYDAGYGTSAVDVPQPIIEAVKIGVMMLYDDYRGTSDPARIEAMRTAWERLLSPYKIMHQW